MSLGFLPRLEAAPEPRKLGKPGKPHQPSLSSKAPFAKRTFELRRSIRLPFAGNWWHATESFAGRSRTSSVPIRRVPERVVALSGALSVCAAASHDWTSKTRARPQIAAAIFTGGYAVVFGLALVLAPKSAFGLLFGSETVSSGWIRIGGILFTLIGLQYLGTAHGDCKGQGALGFYRVTVWSRLALAAAFMLLVATGQSPAGLLVLAGVNVLGAASMQLALSRSGTNADEPEDGSSAFTKM